MQHSEDSQIREIHTRDLGRRDVLDAVEHDSAVYRVTRYGTVIGYLVPRGWVEDRDRAAS